MEECSAGADVIAFFAKLAFVLMAISEHEGTWSAVMICTVK